MKPTLEEYIKEKLSSRSDGELFDSYDIHQWIKEYNELPKERYFNISYNYSNSASNGSGDAPYQCLGYPNRIELKKHLSGKQGQRIVIINIEELSYQDCQDYIKITGEGATNDG